ncbi:MAG: lipase family protein, partial [Ardenticatenales bacterium]
MELDRNLAIQLCAASQFIYPPNDIAGLGLPRPAITILHDKGPIQTSTVGVLRYPDKTVVVFQGTLTGKSVQAVRDWLDNFRVVSGAVAGFAGKVHLGFASQLNGVEGQLITDLKSGFTPPLYITGHSQGGAVAVLATKALQSAGFPVTATYTFAAPRPGDMAFGASVTTPLFRLEYGNDIVPHVPIPASMLSAFQRAMLLVPRLAPTLAKLTVPDTLDYRSIGALVYGAPGQKALTVGLSPAEERKLSEARRLRLLLARNQLFDHHQLDNYRKMLTPA